MLMFLSNLKLKGAILHESVDEIRENWIYLVDQLHSCFRRKIRAEDTSSLLHA